MKIRIDSELKVVEFWAVDQEIPKVTGGSVKKYGPEYLIHTFIKPRLLVDNARIMTLPSTKRDMVVRLLEFPNRVIEYDGVRLSWTDQQYPGVWSPSIDTILFAKALRFLLRSSFFLKNACSFLEIGCGSGFLSKYILQKKLEIKKPIKYAHLMDINHDALTCAMNTIDEVKGTTLISYSLNRPREIIKTTNQHDLVISNPPYIPRPNARINNPFEGLFLYQEIFKRASELLRPGSILLTNFSSISKSEVWPLFVKKFKIKTIYKMKVPLKIPLITARFSEESRKWMNYLEKKDKIIVDRSEKSGYRYWHVIQIVECRLK